MKMMKFQLARIMPVNWDHSPSQEGWVLHHFSRGIFSTTCLVWLKGVFNITLKAKRGEYYTISVGSWAQPTCPALKGGYNHTYFKVFFFLKYTLEAKSGEYYTISVGSWAQPTCPALKTFIPYTFGNQLIFSQDQKVWVLHYLST